MTVGTLRIDLALYEAGSLKDKRRVIKSLVERLKHRFNVSIAEVDHLDSLRRATVGVAMVSNDAVHVHGCLDRIVEFVRRHPAASLIDFEKELL